jgi:hypothetical protein
MDLFQVLYRATRALRAKFGGVNLQWPECVAAVATAQPAVFAFRSKTSADTGAPCCRSDPAAYATKLSRLAIVPHYENNILEALVGDRTDEKCSKP